MQNALPVYIGFDQSQRVASEVCEYSILKRASIPVLTRHLNLQAVQRNGMFARIWRTENGQRIDLRDGKPFSTDFSFTRFLIPMLDMYSGWALFCDGDFLFRADVAELASLADPKYAVMVVKHAHDPSAEKKQKMDGREQTKYRRKNWSSLVLWNCAHHAHRELTINAVNHMPGQWLHAFEWLTDDLIGALPKEWNHLVGVDPPAENIKALHYTLGGPWFEQCRNTPYADEWLSERRAQFSAKFPGLAAPELHAA